MLATRAVALPPFSFLLCSIFPLWSGAESHSHLRKSGRSRGRVDVDRASSSTGGSAPSRASTARSPSPGRGSDVTFASNGS